VSAVITPEMSGKIIDDSHYDFHVTCKAKIINAVNKMKGGMDLLKSLTKLGFKTDERWLKNTCNDPSVKALLEILEEYKKNEHRPTRAKMIVPLIEYAIGLYASDLFFRERGSWYITQIIKRQQEFSICFIPMFADPNNWYPMTRNITVDENGEIVPGAGIQGKEGYFYKQENDPNVQSVEDDYRQWYNIDIDGDTINISIEDRERVIKQGQEYMKSHGQLVV
jgi:hypothetical protein